MSKQVTVQREHHISIAKDQFLTTLLEKFESEKERKLFGEFAAAIEALFHVNLIEKIEAFKAAFAPFSRLSGADHKLSTEALSQRQTALLGMVFDVIKAAHFEPISFEMYMSSIEKIFLSDLPIKVDWPRLDVHLLSDFYAMHPQQNPYHDATNKPPFHGHFALFYRGYGLHVMQGLFLEQKINLILSDVFPMVSSYAAQFLAYMSATLFASRRQKQRQSSSELNSDASDTAAVVIEHYTDKLKLDEQKLERISLLDTYNRAKQKGIGAVLWWLLKNIQIQEPTFKRLILIYREIPETFLQKQARKMKQRATRIKSKLERTAKNKLGMKKSGGGDGEKQQKEAEEEQVLLDEIGRKRKTETNVDANIYKTALKNVEDTYKLPIRVQYFSDVPMSDLEITYPAKCMSLKPMHQIYIVFSIFIGVWSILYELIFSGADTAFGYIMVLTAVFLMVRSIVWYRATESEYVRVLNQALAQSNVSSDHHTILGLIDSIKDHQFMETLLAYFMLLQNKSAVISDSDGVDRLCEKYLKEAFGDSINFPINGAMRKLTELGLFDSNAQSKNDSIRVKSLLDALSCVQQHYASAIQSFRKIGVKSTPHKNDGDDNDDVKQMEEDSTKNGNGNGNGSVPPIIDAGQISDDHFDATGDNEEFTSID